jgi:hypothetical protein
MVKQLAVEKKKKSSKEGIERLAGGGIHLLHPPRKPFAFGYHMTVN